MKKYCFGIDVGGTTVKMGLFTTEGELLDKWEIPTRKEDGGSYILNDVAASVEAKLAEKNIAKDAVVGVGIGGTFERAAQLAKKATFRPIDSKNEDERYAQLEDELLTEINKMGFGPAGPTA